MKEFKAFDVNAANEIPVSQEEPTIYRLNINNSISLSGLYRIHKNPDKIVILFNGAKTKENMTGPSFTRWSWAYGHNLSFVCFDDPIVSGTQLTNLGWYVGTSSIDLQEHINAIVNHIILSLGVNPAHVFFYGSSGGGFAALMAAIRLRGSVAVVNNPQTNIFKYHKSASKLLVDNFFQDINVTPESEIYYRFSVLHAIKKYDYIPPFLYVQNIQDKFHLDRHLSPFQSSVLHTVSSIKDYPNKFCFHFFNDRRGHSIFSDKEEFLNEIHQAANLTSTTQVYPSLFEIKKSDTLSEDIIWYVLQDNTISVDVSFELNFEPLSENAKPAIFLVDTDRTDFHELRKHGYSYSKSLKCAFKYIDSIQPKQKITVPVHKELAAKRIGLRKWKCVGDLHFKDLEVNNKND